MIAIIKAEFRKLFSIRSTYILVGFSLALIMLLSFYFEGYRGNTGSPASLLATTAWHELLANGIGLGVVFTCIAAALNMTHEYRFNTIIYTLTSNARRTRVLLAKMITIALFSAVYGLVATGVSIGSYMFGLSLREAVLPPQDFPLLNELGRMVFYSVAYGLIGLFVATLVRSVVAAIAFLLMFPVTIEPLLSLVLKENTKYLPFIALDSSIGAAVMSQHTLSSNKALVVSTLYLAVTFLVTWFLFVRRDAN